MVLIASILSKRKEMKKGLLGLVILTGSASFGQPVIKLYGYSRESTPGIVRERDPSLPAKKQAHTAINYFLYSSNANAIRIQPVEVWIKGKGYLATSLLVKSPVLSDEGTVLVSKTSGQVREIKTGKELPSNRKIPSWLRHMISANDIVLAYLWKGKKYYVTLKKIKELEIVFGQ
jgi:hypothetical protein